MFLKRFFTFFMKFMTNDKDKGIYYLYVSNFMFYIVLLIVEARFTLYLVRHGFTEANKQGVLVS